MKAGNLKKIFLIFIFIFICKFSTFAADKIDTVPLINLEELSPTFEEDKDELEKIENKNVDLENFNDEEKKSDKEKNEKIYINLKALDKITAKTSAIKLVIGEKKFFGPLEIKALKCASLENNDSTDTVAYLQVKDLSAKIFMSNTPHLIHYQAKK